MKSENGPFLTVQYVVKVVTASKKLRVRIKVGYSVSCILISELVASVNIDDKDYDRTFYSFCTHILYIFMKLIAQQFPLYTLADQT